MTGEFDVDIIILSFNRVDETIGAIESALEQTGLRVNVVVLDQGSAPDQLAKLEAFCAGKPVHLELGRVNLGVAGGRNRASRLGRAPYIIALDNDAIFSDSDSAKRAVDYLKADSQLAAIGFQILNYTTHEIDESSWGYPSAIRHRWNEEFDTTKFIGAGHALVRKHYEAAGEYDDRLFFCWEEFDLCYRLINMGFRIRYVPRIKILHKVSPEKRVSWDGGRYYYLMRNRLYIYAKYGEPINTLMFAGGYIIKGAANGVFKQVPPALIDAVKLVFKFRRETKDRRLYKLSQAAKAYIRAYDTKLRGSLWRRMKAELLGRLPGRNNAAAPLAPRS